MMASRVLQAARRAPAAIQAAHRTLATARPVAMAEKKLEKNVEYRKQIVESQDPKERPGGSGVTGRIPDDFEHATGLERKELIELAKGNDDPFGLEGVKWGPLGTKEAPREIPSHEDARIVGCCCDPESEQIKFFEVKAGPPQACPCSQQHFKLVPAEGEVSW